MPSRIQLEEPIRAHENVDANSSSAVIAAPVYEAIGIPMEDMVAASLTYTRAAAQNGGGVMRW